MASESECARSIQRLVSLPSSLRKLTVEFAAGTSLDTLEFHACNGQTGGASLVIPAESSSTRPRIRVLKLCSSTETGILTSPACPFNFTLLTHVWHCDCTGLILNRFLRRTGATITSMRIEAKGRIWLLLCQLHVDRCVFPLDMTLMVWTSQRSPRSKSSRRMARSSAQPSTRTLARNQHNHGHAPCRVLSTPFPRRISDECKGLR